MTPTAIRAGVRVINGRLTAIAVWLNTCRGARSALLAWIGISLIEYVILGPRSFIWMDDEGELVITHYNFLSHIHPGGQYSHLLQSGVDAKAAFFFGSAYLSLDRFLLGSLPTWIGIGTHKVFIFAVGAWGTYLACRKGLGCSRVAAVAFSALFTVMYYRLQIVTFGTGGGFALLPLGIYLCVIRWNRPRYYIGTFAYAILFAGTSTFHGLLSLVPALISSAILLGRLHPQILVSIAVIVLAFLTNNAESFAAMLVLSPHSVRGSVSFGMAPPFVETFLPALVSGFHQALFSAPLMSGPILLATAIFTWRRNWSWLARTTGAVVAPPAMIAVFAAFPWQILGLSSIHNTPYGMLIFGLLPVSALAGAKAADLTEKRLKGRNLEYWRNVPGLIILAIAAVILLQYKVHNFRAWLTTAGQSMYATIDNLRDKSWIPAEPFRAISLRHKQMQPEPNIFASFYGVAMLDAWINLVLINRPVAKIAG